MARLTWVPLAPATFPEHDTTTQVVEPVQRENTAESSGEPIRFRSSARLGVAALAAVSAAAACIAPTEPVDTYAIGIAKVGDTYRMFVPLCPGEKVVGVTATDDDPVAPSTGLRPAAEPREVSAADAIKQVESVLGCETYHFLGDSTDIHRISLPAPPSVDRQTMFCERTKQFSDPEFHACTVLLAKGDILTRLVVEAETEQEATRLAADLSSEAAASLQPPA